MDPLGIEPEKKRPDQQKASSPGQTRPSSPSESGRKPPSSGGSGASGGGGGGEIKRWSQGTWLKILAVIALLFGGYYFFTGQGSSVHTSPGSGQGEKSANYKYHQQVNPNLMAQLTPADIDQNVTRSARQAAQTGRPIPELPGATPQLLDAIKRGEVTFYRVRAYDTCDEDGDWISISSDSGVSYAPFVISNAGRWLTIPMIGNTPPHITLTGVKDGVGGITAGIQTSTGIWYSKVLQEGESQPVPFSN